MARKAPMKERTIRRWRILSGRARRTAPGAAPHHRSIFFHMPKCGGTSLSEAMYATVPFNHRIGVIDALSTRRAAAMQSFGQDDLLLCHEDLDNGQAVFDLREMLMLQHMAWDTWLIHGHVFWSDLADTHFGDTYRYVTVLRDPIERTLSNFRMAQRTGLVTGSLDAYLEGPVARRHSKVFLRYLAGRNDFIEAELPAAVELAKDRLAKFALIGFLDESRQFAQNYQKMFGAPLKLARLNAAPDQKLDITAQQRDRLEVLCAPDLAIYQQARELARH